MANKSAKSFGKNKLLVIVLVLLVVSTLFSAKNQKNQEFENQAQTTQNDKLSYNPETKTIRSQVITRPVDEGKYQFSIDVPETWEVQKAEGEMSYSSIILEKNNHKLEISSPVAGSSTCVYPGEKADPPEYGLYTKYTSIETSFGTLRMSEAKIAGDSNSQIIDGCQKEVSTSWSTYTKLGYIKYKLPGDYDKNIYYEMNQILKSITYIEL